MNWLAWNARGINTPARRRVIKELVRANKVGILGLTETKMQQPSEFIAKQMWRKERFGWEAIPSIGRSGGLFLLWSQSVFRCATISKGARWLCVEGTLIASDISCAILLVYGPSEISDQCRLWEDLVSMKNSSASELWVVLGDFNVVLERHERKGRSNFGATASHHFRKFIDDMCVMDMPLCGRKFTWSNSEASSRLDRFLVSPQWTQLFPDSIQLGLYKSGSDHNPVLVRTENVNWGPKPFRFYTGWMLKQNFREKVEAWWKEFSSEAQGPNRVVFKLKLLKAKLRAECFVPFADMYSNVRSLEEELEGLDLADENSGLNDEQKNRRREIPKEIWHGQRMIDSMWQQRSRAHWGLYGDRNTKYFHALSKIRDNSNHIGVIQARNGVFTKPGDIKRAAIDHFGNQYKEVPWTRPSLDHSLFDKISPEASFGLEQIPTEDEIKQAVWSCDSDKAPGPDGFCFSFYKKCWDIIQDDVFAFVKHFFHTSSLLSEVKASFITLVPKCHGAKSFKDFRPISLVGSLYKIITKILSSRLKRVMCQVIGPEQSGFIEGRQLQDGVMICSETINWLKKTKSDGVFIKLDFKKAFDCVSWNFLDSMLVAMGFGLRWRSWVFGCLRGSSASVLINGSPTSLFTLERGLKQGDPMSPYLFLIVVEGLRRMILRAKSLNLIQGLPLPGMNANLCILQFADDTLLITKPHHQSISNLKHILLSFSLVSGLTLNFDKCSIIGINTNRSWMEWATWSWGCKSQSLPFKYLGVPIGASMRQKTHWEALVELFDKRLSSWKGNLLSIGGRMVLIKSVLSSLPIFYMSIFKVRAGILRTLEEKMRKFLWTGDPSRRGLSLVPWCYVCLPVDKGGMGVIRLELQNEALRLKWIWRFLTDPNALWVRVIRSIHGEANTALPSPLSHVPCRDRLNGIWNSIYQLAISNAASASSFRQNISFTLGRGNYIRMWEDVWCSNLPLSNLFPRLYLLSTQKGYPVQRFCHASIVQNTWAFSWRRGLRGWEEDSFRNLLSTLPPTSALSEADDRVKWNLAQDTEFSVHGLYNHLFDGFTFTAPPVLRKNWIRLVPPKVGYFLWMALLSRVKTRDNLHRVGLLRPEDTKCPLCGVERESSGHLFIHCPTASKVWNFYANLLHIRWSCTSSPMSFLDAWLGLVQGKRLQQIWFVIFAAVCWSIWRIRNRIVFDGATFDHGRLLTIITRRIYEWIHWSGLANALCSQDVSLFLQSVNCS